MSIITVYLAHWAVVGAAAGDAGFEDGGAAARARQALATKDASEVDVTPLFAFGVDVVFIR